MKQGLAVLAVLVVFLGIVILGSASTGKVPVAAKTSPTLGVLFCGEDGKLYAKVFSHDTSTSPRGFRVEPILKNNHDQYICVDTDTKVIIK